MAGNGETTYGGPLSTQLQKVTLTVIPNDQCNQNYAYRITDSQMCTLTPYKDVCNVSGNARFEKYSHFWLTINFENNYNRQTMAQVFYTLTHAQAAVYWLAYQALVFPVRREYRELPYEWHRMYHGFNRSPRKISAHTKTEKHLLFSFKLSWPLGTMYLFHLRLFLYK